ncbi:hypothetical protein VP277E431_P0023 [Vibrio phage 277E43-1]|nr:hypothetical protein VP277E431_P0023 [Vibrio phage 277E43-1]
MEIKDCPFCGSKADYDWGASQDVGGSLVQVGWVECTNTDCTASIDITSINGNITSQDLINKWNSRV